MSNKSVPSNHPKDIITMPMAGWTLGMGIVIFLIGIVSNVGVLTFIGGALTNVGGLAFILLWYGLKCD